MAFQLKAKESVSDGITRSVTAQLEKVLEHARATGKAHRRGEPENEAVHEIRKCFKRIRAALRLVRDELGDDLYHEENWCFRDAARPITQVRDAEVLVETVDKLTPQLTPGVDPAALARIHDALLASQRDITRRVLHDDKAFAAVDAVATRALARLGDWRIAHDGWTAMESGLKRVYRRGHRGLAASSVRATVGNLHEWRKQSNYLWHQLQLLEAPWTASQKELVDQTHALSTLLGEDHDLAVLRETLAADPLAYGGHAVLKGVFAVTSARREELEQQAFALGRKLYKDSPEHFTNRIEGFCSGRPVQPKARERVPK